MLTLVPHPDPSQLGPPVLPLGARVQIAGAEFKLTDITGHQQVFKRRDGMETLPLWWNQYVTLWQNNELRVLPSKGMLKASKMRVAQIPFELFSAETQTAILHKHYYCQAMDNALRDGTLAKRSKDNVVAWLEKPLAFDKGYTRHPSRGTVMRDYALWIASGKRISVLAHGNALALRKSVFGEIVVDIIKDVLEAYSAPNPDFSLENAQFEIADEIARRIADGELIADRIPAISTIANYKRKMNDYLVLQLQEGTYEADRQLQPRGKLVVPDFPMSRWEVDHTLLPVRVAMEFKDANGNTHTMIVGKVWCTAVIDASTRFVLAVVLGIDPPSSLRVMRALRMAMSPKSQIFMDFGIENKLDICLLPVSVMIDNGKDFHSFMVSALLNELAITQMFAGVYRGDHKPFIERFFRTLKAFLRKVRSEDLSKDRGPKRQDQTPPKPMTMRQLERFIWKWLCDVYHIRPHAGLQKDTPLNVMIRGIQRLEIERSRGYPAPLRSFAEYSAIEIEAMFSIRKTLNVDDRGVRFENLFWNSGALKELGLKQVEARINPEDLGTILVFSLRANRYIRVPNTLPFYATGLSLSVHKRVWARIRENAKTSSGSEARRGVLSLATYVKNECQLLRELLDITGKPNLPRRSLFDGVAVLGPMLDLATACNRLDAIDIQSGRKPPGMEEIIDLELDEDGSFAMQPTDVPAHVKRKPYTYPGAASSQTDEELAGVEPADVNQDPIAGFDPEALS